MSIININTYSVGYFTSVVEELNAELPRKKGGTWTRDLWIKSPAL